MSIDSIEGMRKNYQEEFPDLVPFDSPFLHFKDWFNSFLKYSREEPNAMHIASVDSSGMPDCRVVLLKGFSEEGFVFYTNYLSKKGTDLANNPNISANFYWFEQNRQIRIQGCVQRLNSEENDKYFYSRPVSSQKGAIASPQSQKIESKSQLNELFNKVESLDLISRPEHWGGYRIIPNRFEFWQGRPSRMHERLVYEINANVWSTFLIAP